MKYYIKIDELESVFDYDIYELKEEAFFDKQIEITKPLFVVLQQDKELLFIHGEGDYQKLIPNYDKYFNATIQLTVYDEILHDNETTLVCKVKEWGCWHCISEKLNSIRIRTGSKHQFNVQIRNFKSKLN